MMGMTDFVFRCVPPLGIFVSSIQPVTIPDKFPEFVDLDLMLPKCCLFADLLVDDSSGEPCGFSFQFDPEQLEQMQKAIRFASPEHVFITPSLQQPLDSTPGEYRVNILWEQPPVFNVQLEQLDEVQWIVGCNSEEGEAGLIGLSCVRAGEASHALLCSIQARLKRRALR